MKSITCLIITIAIIFMPYFDLKDVYANNSICRQKFSSFGKNKESESLGSYKPSVYASIPSNEAEYYAIFGTSKKFTKTKENEMRSAKDNLSSMNYSVTYAGIRNNKKSLEEFIKDVPDNHFYLVGHNDKGYFIFPNKDKIKLKDISDISEKYNKIPIILSCGSFYYLSDYPIATKHDLTYREANIIINTIEEELSVEFASNIFIEKKHISEEIDSVVRKTRLSESRKRKVAAVIMGGCVLIAAVTYPEDLDQD